MIASTGWTWEQAGALTLPQLRALQKQWSENPPTHLLLKAIVEGLGGRRKSGTATPAAATRTMPAASAGNECSDEDYASLVALFGAPQVKKPRE